MNRGAMPPKVDLRDYEYISSSAKEYPKQFELIMAEVKDQGNVNSCVAHVAAEIEEYHTLREEGNYKKLSPGFIYGCRYDYKGQGMYLRDALKTLKNRGICTLEEFKYNEEVPTIIDKFNSIKEWKTNEDYKITSYFKLNPKDTNQIRDALICNGPVMASVFWYDDIKVNNGLIQTTQRGPGGYHCVVICGYTECGWIIQNSWGEHWGNHGKAVYPFEYEIAEVYGIADEYISSKIKIKKYNKFVELMIKIVNFIINSLWIKN